MVVTNCTANPLIRVAQNTALDYFYRMGGGNCYGGYDNWHALALVVFLYHEKDNCVLTQSLESEDWIDYSLWWKCDDLVQKVRSELQDVEADVADYIDWADKYVVTGLYANPSRKHEWDEFKAKLDDLLKKCANLEHSCPDRAKGAMYGLAIGDAMGAPVEFRPRGKFTPVTNFRDGGPFKLKAGQWTDDTAMALCLAASLIECNGMDTKDQMDRYLRWVNDGYMSCTGKE